MKFRSLAALLAAALALVTITGCSPSGAPSPGGGPDTVKIGSRVDVISFDPSALLSGGEFHPYFQAVYDPLLHYTPEGQIEPWLATSYEYNDDRTELTLTLRDDVTFSEGTPLDADAVKANLDHIRTSQTGLAGSLTDIESISAPDATTVVISLSAPVPSLVYLLAHQAGFTALPSTLEDESALTSPVGSGPYVLDAGETVQGSKYVFTAREGYWAADAQKFQRVEILPIIDPTARMNALMSGQIDSSVLDAKLYEQAENAGAVLVGDSSASEGLRLFDRDGTLVPALGDVRVRQAINYAVDGQKILDEIYAGKGELTSQLFSPAQAAYLPELDSHYSYDPVRAKELMAEAGYADGFTLPVPLPSASDPTQLTLVGQQLADIGITLEFVDVPSTEVTARVLRGEFAASFAPAAMDNTWADVQRIVAPGGPLNPFRSSTQETESALHDMQYGTDEEFAAAAQELNTYLVDQAWFATYYRPADFFLVKGDFTVTAQIGTPVPSLYNYSPGK